MPELDISTLDVPDTEILNAPEPEPVVETKVEPVAETAERLRDPGSGKFVAQAPADIADPIKAAETPAVVAPVEQPKVIPLAAHIAERTRWQTQLEENKRELDRVNSRIAALEPKAPEPDFIEDPKGYVDAQTQKAQTELKSLREEATRLQEQQQFSQFQNTVASHESEFIKANPDYYDAISHVRNIRIQQLAEIYPDASQEQVKQAIAQEELAGAYQFMQGGRNPAEGSYKLAQTYGYKKAEKAELKEAPRIAVPKAPVADPGSTLGSGGGGGDVDDAELGEDDLTAEAVAQLAIRERFGARR